MRWYAAEHILGRGSVVILCAAGAADGGQGSLRVPHQLPAQPVVQGEAGQARNGGYLVKHYLARAFDTFNGLIHSSMYYTLALCFLG